MTAVDLLRREADFAFSEFKENLKGITEKQAWAVIPAAGDEYLHTDGSVQGIVLHVAGCKFMYGSIAFRNSEIRWRDVAARMDGFEPSWPAALAYLDEAHAYWLSTWADLTDADLDREVPHFSGKLWAVWRILEVVIHHDGYHGGQLAVIRYGTNGSSTPPPSSAEDVRKYCGDLPDW